MSEFGMCGVHSFFFFKQKTAYEVRISDWSSDVCSSDLVTSGGPRIVFPNRQRSFSPSVVFPTVIPHFCCRAVMDWPRAALLLTMTLVRSEERSVGEECVRKC